MSEQKTRFTVLFGLAVIIAVLAGAYSWLGARGPVRTTDRSDAASPDDESNPAFSSPGGLSFPGAIGHGRFSKGGRGGKIIKVTTLQDRVAGSLRSCIEQEGPRVCVFEVTGVIRFEGRSPAIIHPFITIAGQTAPGGGVLLSHSGGETGSTPLVIKNTHDVIVRHIRVRMDRPAEARASNDAVTIENSRNVIIDHVSASWAVDELIDGYKDNDSITVANSIFSEGIPPHDKCALLSSDSKIPQKFSFVGNICASSGDRNPELNFPPESCVEVVNNVIYNAGSEFVEVWESSGGTPASIVGNIFRSGPSTSREAAGISLRKIGSKGPSRIYADDNIVDGPLALFEQDMQEALTTEPPCPLTMTPLPAEAAYGAVLTTAGAHPLDEVDQRIVGEVRNRTGRIVTGAGVLPEFVPAEAELDRDGDGIPDSTEVELGSDPDRHDAWADADGDGWSNLDDFLDGAHQRLVQ